MQAKIHKAKLITIHNKIIDPESIYTSESPTGIHAYMTLLRHLIQKNHSNVKVAHDFASSSCRLKMNSTMGKRKQSKNNLTSFNTDLQSKKKIGKESHFNRQQILTNIVQSSKNLIEINSFTRFQRSKEKGIQSERIGRRDDEYRNFIPIGKIYHQLKHKTETAEDLDIKTQMNSSAHLKISNDRMEERKRFSIYAKQTRSTQRSVFRQQNRSNTHKPPIQLSAKALFHISRQTKTESQAAQEHSPAPW